MDTFDWLILGLLGNENQITQSKLVEHLDTCLQKSSAGWTTLFNLIILP